MRRILEWLNHFNNGITFATWAGLPVTLTAGAGAAAWAYLEKMGPLTAVLVFCFIFVSMLWSWIGAIWLVDRAQANKKPLLDSSWGIRIDGGLLIRDVSPLSRVEWQVVVILRNTCKWPLRVEVDHQETIIENIVTKEKLDYVMPFIMSPDSSTNLNFPGYIKHSLPDKERWEGRVHFTLKYGHPDGSYSRVMSRKLIFYHVLKGSYPPGLGPALFPASATVPINFGAYEIERDEPYP